ncbi:hypothetical protein MVEN_00593800 [Mycena venus]|uniref:Uncharacterized protein n=1 Tax=Mycena venus TaxID=2733690 RepID=A0A8H6YNX8_9AGAR|nr:hypothetical protein MVEN_00593800 [Mycena venus]
MSPENPSSPLHVNPTPPQSRPPTPLVPNCNGAAGPQGPAPPPNWSALAAAASSPGGQVTQASPAGTLLLVGTQESSNRPTAVTPVATSAPISLPRNSIPSPAVAFSPHRTAPGAATATNPISINNPARKPQSSPARTAQPRFSLDPPYSHCSVSPTPRPSRRRAPRKETSVPWPEQGQLSGPHERIFCALCTHQQPLLSAPLSLPHLCACQRSLFLSIKFRFNEEHDHDPPTRLHN